MQGPRENSIFDLQLQHKYRFYKERTGELINELNNLGKLLPELTLSSCQNDQDFSENIRSQSLDIEQIETNKSVLVRMQEYIPFIKDKMLSISILDDLSLSILNQLYDHLARLGSILIEYNNDLGNYHEKFLNYTSIGKEIKKISSITILFLHDLRNRIKHNLQKIFSDTVDFLPDSFLPFIDEEESEQEPIISSPTTQQSSEKITNISNIESKEANQHRYDEHIFLDLPEEIQILLLSTMTCKDAVTFGMTASYYNNIMKDQLLWKVFFKRDFSYHYPALTVLEKYRTIDWKKEYKLAKKNPPWPFPMEIKEENVSETTLVDAIKNKQAESVILNLRQGITVQRHYFKHALIARFSPFIFELLIEATKSNQELLDYALYFACEQNNSLAAAILIKAGANINSYIYNSELEDYLSPIHAAIQHGDLFLVKMLLDLGSVAYDSAKFPLLYFLLSNAINFDTLKELSIFDRQDVNKYFEYKDRSVSLIEKITFDQKPQNIKMFEWLLDNGADPNILLGYKKTTPILHFLILLGGDIDFKMGLIKKLLKYKPNLEARDDQGYTGIHLVIALHNFVFYAEELTLLLLDENAKLDVTNNNGETILHSFLRKNQNSHKNYFFDHEFEFLLRILLNHIDVNSTDNQGVSPLNIAMNNALALSKMILMKLVPADISDQNQKNILHKFASMSLCLSPSDESIIRKKITLLVKCGVDPNKKDTDGETPLQIAVNQNNTLVFQSLIENGAKIGKLKFMKHRPYPEIHSAINCHRYIEQAIAIVKNKDSLLFFSWKPLDRIKSFLTNASLSDWSLSINLLSNYLFGNDLSNSQKERLVDSLFLLNPHTFHINFWENLSKLAREGRSIQLPANKIIKVLETYLDFMTHDRYNHPATYQEEINQIKELIENYRKNTITLTNVNHNE